MPTNRPFFPNPRPVKKVVTPQGEVLVRKECRCGKETLLTVSAPEISSLAMLAQGLWGSQHSS